MTTIALANQYLQQGNYSQAETTFKQLLSQNKDNLGALWGLAEVAFALNSFQRAYQLLVRCLHLNSRQVPVYLSLAKVCRALRQFDKVEQALLSTLKLDDKNLTVLFELAVFYSEAGDYLSCENYLQKITSIEPLNIRAFALAVRLKKVDFDGNNINDYCQAMLQKLEQQPNLHSFQRALLHYSFFELYDGCAMYDKAFAHLQQGNRLQYQDTKFKVADMSDYFHLLKQTFTPHVLQSESVNSAANSPKVTPIFIVGQPRSGSTLLEQLLIAHDEISSAGELSIMASDIGHGIHKLTGKHFPEGAALLNGKQRQLLAEHYLQQLTSIAPNSNYVIDKMPANYQSIGLIKLLLPHAKIIHITREPIDVSWSIYRNNFSANEPYFSALADIISYHHHYQSIMDHWLSSIPEFIHHISYENLVTNPSENITKLLHFCGLEFQHKCGSLNSQGRYINTLSDIQLRQGIDANLPKRWLHYQQYIPSLINAFKPLANE